MLTLGDADAVEQLRAALAVGCTAATHVVADAGAFGPADVAREIAAVVRDHEAAGRVPRPGAAGQRRRRHRRLPGRHPARLRARPAGRQRRHDGVGRGRRRARSSPQRRRPRRARDLPRPAAGGGHRPRGRRGAALPDGPRPDEGQEGARSRSASPSRDAGRPGPGAAGAARRPPRATCRCSARAPRPPPRWSTSSSSWGCWPDDPRPGREGPRPATPSRCRCETITFARDLVRGRRRRARRRRRRRRGVRPGSQAARGVRRPRRARARPAPPSRRSPGPRWAAGIETVLASAALGGGDRRRHPARQRGPGPRRRPGRGGDGRQRAVVRRPVALRGHPAGRRRRGAGGDAGSSQRPAVFTVAGHAVEAGPPPTPGAGELVEHAPDVAEADLWPGSCPPRSPSPTCPAA